jgi:hypothetical protein
LLQLQALASYNTWWDCGAHYPQIIILLQLVGTNWKKCTAGFFLWLWWFRAVQFPSWLVTGSYELQVPAPSKMSIPTSKIEVLWSPNKEDEFATFGNELKLYGFQVLNAVLFHLSTVEGTPGVC